MFPVGTPREFLVPVVITRTRYLRAHQPNGTETAGHWATDASDGRTLCGLDLADLGPAVLSVRVAAFGRGVECHGCNARITRATSSRW